MTSPQKIKKTTLSDQVSKALKEKIRSGEWAENARIPSENELAEAFGVNRLTVRNALQKLNAMGIVETRAGEGTFVKQFDLLEYISEISDLITSPEMLAGVMDFRRCIEIECGRLAIERACEDDIAELENAYQKYEAIAKENAPFEEHMNALVKADLDFHSQRLRYVKMQSFHSCIQRCQRTDVYSMLSQFLLTDICITGSTITLAQGRKGLPLLP